MIQFLSILLLLLLKYESLYCDSRFKYFETINEVSVLTYSKRSTDDAASVTKRLRFTAFQRAFDVILKSGCSGLMAEGFQASLIKQDGSSSRFQVDETITFTGYLRDNPSILVQAHLENTLWNMQIFETDDVYVVEPARRLLNQTQNPNNHSLIVFKTSDLVSDHPDRWCKAHSAKPQFMSSFPPVYNYTVHDSVKREHREPEWSGSQNLSYNADYTFKAGRRAKRGLHDKVCVLYIIIDYSFFSGRCHSDHLSCSALVFSFVNLANKIFVESIFEDQKFEKYTEIGFTIGEIAIYTTHTTPYPNYPYRHFNEDVPWTAEGKLDSFGYFANILTHKKKFCAHMLFTNNQFEGQIVGISLINTVCDSYGESGKQKTSIGLSTGRGKAIGDLPSIQLNLVFAHELGHIFGSEHDPVTPECSKREVQGGNFLMWPQSVVGTLPNHFKFSPCSLRYIGATLSDRHCFVDRSSAIALCGNGVVETGEACDAGAFGLIDTDRCCSDKCQLKKGATCSEVNEPCCENCKTARAKTVCKGREELICKKESYCTGTSTDCPEAQPVEDWTYCHGRTSQCYKGKCLDFCQVLSKKKTNLQLQSCMCRTNVGHQACKMCCFPYNSSSGSNTGQCQVYSEFTLPDGEQCYQGHCQDGVCISDEMTPIRRINQFLPKITISELGEFMKSNIVVTVVVLSLVVFLPSMAVTSYLDYKEKKRRKAAQKCNFRSEVDDELGPGDVSDNLPGESTVW